MQNGFRFASLDRFDLNFKKVPIQGVLKKERADSTFKSLFFKKVLPLIFILNFRFMKYLGIGILSDPDLNVCRHLIQSQDVD